MNKKQIYCDVRARFTEKDSDADIIVTLEVQNNRLIGKCSYLEAENDNLRRMYTELWESTKEAKNETD